MATIFEVQSLDIKSLNDLYLTKLLKMLLHLEARSAGIDERAVEVALNIRVADGGEDGRIEWDDGPETTNFLPARLVQFQNKATDMGVIDCANEIVDSKGKLKFMVEQALDNGGAYILFTTQELNGQQKSRRINAIRAKLKQLKKPYSDTSIIKIYDASTIQGWVNHYASAITATLHWVGKPLVHGLCTWEEWEGFGENHHFEYVADQFRREAIESLRNSLCLPKRSARIIGLSGLGKTRLALEVCRGNSSEDGFSKRVVYIDAAYGEPNLAGLVQSWIKLKIDALLVVDNCDLTLHKQLRREIEHPDSSISLLTLHYDLEKDSDTNPIQLKQMSDDLIKSMLQPVYSEKISDLDRIVNFAQGFPQMAVLLAKARLDHASDMGSLTDDELVKKMLWGRGDHNHKSTQILEACSLFDKFGIDLEREEEAKFIAEQIAHTDLDTLYKCIRTFEERGLVNRAGRLVQIVPKPLAIRLAADWWRSTRTQRQQELIETIMPGQLEKSFCEQVAKLDFLPEVKDLTQNLCGNQGPFGQVEVILSFRGSRLFHSLVEVNPKATSEALYKILSSLSHEELFQISSEVRRNLVWALEKLCFHREVFTKSANCLLWLALAENEDWANNATGQFLQLFRTFLSGTEAEPELRLELIDELIKTGTESERKIAVKALESAIDTHGGSRTVGAEYQGSGEPLVEWKPKIWKEAFDYWIAALEKLTSLATENNEIGVLAKHAIASHIRGLITSNREVMMALDQSIRKVVEIQGPFWPKALDRIKAALSFDSEKMPDELKEILYEWIALLTPNRIEDRIALIVSIPPYEHQKDSDGHYTDISEENVEKFSQEFVNNISVLSPHLPQLLTGDQRYGFRFGQTLIKNSGNSEAFIKEAVRLIQTLKSPNLNFMRGLLAGLYEINKEQWQSFIYQFKSNKILNKYYPEVVSTGKIQEEHLDSIINLIESGNLNADRLSVLTYGRPLDHLDPKSVIKFIQHLRKTSHKAGWLSLDILTMYCYGDNGKWEFCSSEFKDILINLPLDQKSQQHNQMDVFHWKEAVEKLLKKCDYDFATQLTKQILLSISKKIDFGDSYHYIKPVMRILLKDYGVKVWPHIANAIKYAEPIDQYHLSQLLSKEDNFNTQLPSVLAELPEEILHEWCKNEPDTAPIFIARSTDVYYEEDELYKLSPRAKYLIDEFGNNQKVLSELSANMGTFGWCGSVVPIYQKEISALESLKIHKHQSVRKWVESRIEYLNKAIKKETMLDEEQEWGVR